jgi:hypothetical protein
VRWTIAGDFGRYEMASQWQLSSIELATPGLVGAPGFHASTVEQTRSDRIFGERGGGRRVPARYPAAGAWR